MKRAVLLVLCTLIIASLFLAQVGVVAAWSWDDVWDKAEEYVEEAEEWWDETKDTVSETAEDYVDGVGEWWDETKGTVSEITEDYVEEAGGWWTEAKETISESVKEWIEEESPKYLRQLGNWGQQALEFLDREMTEEAKEWLLSGVEEHYETIIPIPYIADNDRGALTFAKISLLRGTVEIYEPTKEEVVVLLTNKVLDKMSHGAISVEEIQELSVQEVGHGEYKAKVRANGKLLWYIPAAVDYEPTVQLGESWDSIQLKDIDNPWWSIFVR